MTDAQVIDLLRSALVLVAKLAAPILLASLVVGVMVSLLQTITQIQEMTLTFVPKLVVSALILLFAGNWMIHTMTDWVIHLWSGIPDMVG
jgi:flagellar biosynthetic protein FliQ